MTRTYALAYGSTFSWGNGVPADDGSAAVYPLVPAERANVAISIRNPGSFSVILDGVSFATVNVVVEDATVIVNAMSNPNGMRAGNLTGSDWPTRWPAGRSFARR